MARDCLTVRAQLSQQHDGLPLAPAVAAACAHHLAGCAACRAYEQNLTVQDELLRDVWPNVQAPAGFAARTVALLPPRPRQHRWRWVATAAAAVLLAMVGLLLAGGGDVRAGLALALRRVGLAETSPPTQIVAAPLRTVTLAEAQTLVPWPLRTPAGPPAGYRLTGVAVGEGYQFAAGPTVILFYSREGATTPQLVITQFQPASQPVLAPIAPGAGRQVMIGEHEGLYVEGLWVERAGGTVWEPGTLVRLIIEGLPQVVQFEADPAAGWNAETLIALAQQLR